MVVAASVARTDRGQGGSGRFAGVRRERQTSPRLRRLDTGRRHRRIGSRTGAHVGNSGRTRRRRAGVLGHRSAARQDGPRYRSGQLTAPGGAAGFGFQPRRRGPRATAKPVALSGSTMAGACTHPAQRRGARGPGTQPRIREMGCLRRFFRDHQVSASGHPNSISRALGIGISTLGGPQSVAKRGQTIHEFDESPTRHSAAAPARERGPVRTGRSR